MLRKEHNEVDAWPGILKQPVEPHLSDGDTKRALGHRRPRSAYPEGLEGGRKSAKVNLEDALNYNRCSLSNADFGGFFSAGTVGLGRRLG